MDFSRTLILECGAHHVSLAVFRRRGSRLCLHHFATEKLAPALSADPDGCWLEQIRVGFLALAVRAKMCGPAVIILPAHLSLIKAIKVPRVALPQRDKIIRFEAEQAIPYAMAEVGWDSAVVGETPDAWDVLLATAKNTVLEPLCAAAHAAGFEPRVILPAPCATLAGFKLIHAAKKESYLGLNLGPRSGTFVLAEADRFTLRTFALHHDSNPVQTPRDNAASTAAVDPVRARLSQEITRSLLYFQGRSCTVAPHHVWLTGEGAKQPDLRNALQLKMQVPVHTPDMLEFIDFSRPKVADSAGPQASTFLDLIGAAATQLYPEQAVVNLLPARERAAASHRRRRPWLIVAALLVIGAGLPPLEHFRQLREEAAKKNAAIEREVAPLRVRALTNETTLLGVAALRRQISFIETVQERRSSWLRLMISLQLCLSEVGDVWLERIQITPPHSGAPLRLFVTGHMLDRVNPLAKVSPETVNRVKTVLARLEATPFITAVEAERFDNQHPGILKFDFVLVADLERPL